MNDYGKVTEYSGFCEIIRIEIEVEKMDISIEILKQAMTRFDSTGFVAEKGGAVLILGLESTRERNLDEMALKDGRMRLYGWTKHVKPRMMDLIDVFKERGFEAEPVGWWGYPSGDTMRLKRWAVIAGLGQQGKNTLVLHSTFGTRLRLAALWTNAPLTPKEPGIYEQRENPLCQSCNACIDICPVEGLLQPYRLLAPARCLVNMESVLVRDRVGECREACRTICPIGR